ncbi:MAG: glycosyltransferase 87 family protein [Pirellulales bacterium]
MPSPETICFDGGPASGTVQRPPWYLNPRWQQAGLWLVAVAAVVEGGYAIFLRGNDFNCHLEFGRHFLQGNPYSSQGNYYPLGRLMLDSLLPLGEYFTTRAVCYLLAVAGLFAVFAMWGRMADAWFPGRLPQRRGAVLLTLAALLPLLIRDLDECGLQIFLLLLLTLAAHAQFHGGKWQSGFWLAAAVTYKATPLLFLPLLLWKREWKSAASLAMCVVGLNLLPAVYLGWDTTIASHRYWLVNSASIMRDTPEAYPSIPHGIEAPQIRNASLKAGLARFVETYPPGHPLHLKHPLFFQFGALPVEWAKPTVNGIILLLGLAIAWTMRRSWAADSTRQGLLKDWAVACIFTALMSPICWKQHLILLIPAIYLLSRWILAGATITRWQWWLMACCGVVFLGTRRTIVGEELSLLLQSYHLLTWAALAVVWLVIRLPQGTGVAALQESLDESAELPRRDASRLLQRAAG